MSGRDKKKEKAEATTTQSAALENLTHAKQVELPAVTISRSSKHLEIRCDRAAAALLPCTATVLRTFAKKPVTVQVDAGAHGLFTLTRNAAADLFAQGNGALQVSGFELAGETLRPRGKFAWLQHELIPAHAPEKLSEDITKSWTDSVSLAPARTGPEGRKIGLRGPQIGALHALAAHWTLGERTALVVMPTGTGKTEVMLAHTVMTAPKRLLVLVPTDPLREQTFEKFVGLGILHRHGIIHASVQKPVVGLLRRAPQTEADFALVSQCNVVVSTVAMLEHVPSAVLKKFSDQFDAVYFDEAHHLRARSWERVFGVLDRQRVVAFTATPYREDGLRIPLRIVYNYPLRLAQEKGYFRKIDFIEVNEIDPHEADEQIAEKAVARLKEDEAKGSRHLILARVGDRARAKLLFDSIYQPRYGELNPVLIYSGIAGKNDILTRIRRGEHRIIVCVDMFGEGFDLPALKIAAMHDIHRSLAITLQFTGRFTRDAHGVGDATLIANVAEPKVSDAIEELYAEDPDWNAIIPKLSARAIQSQLNFAQFLDRVPQGYGEEQSLFDLNIIRPKTSTVIYSCPDFQWKNFRKGLRSGDVKVHRWWPSTDKDMLVFVTHTRLRIDWAMIKETTDEVWDVFVLAYDRPRKLLYIHSSHKGSLHSDLATAVGGDRARIIDGDRVFKAMHGIGRLILYSAGLYGRGRMRFRMLTGLDIAEAIGPAAQAGSTRANLFGAGYANGKRVTIGASAKGRLWSMSSSPIPDWFEWCQGVATKILDPNVRADAILQHTLVATALTALPATEVFTLLLPDDWLDANASLGKLFLAGKSYDLSSCGITSVTRTTDGKIEFETDVTGEQTLGFQMRWGPDEAQFGVQQVKGPDATLRVDNANQDLTAFFRENPPVLLLVDGSEVRGGRHLKPSDAHPYTFDVHTIIAADWTNVPIQEESKWKHGVMRAASIQGKVINDCVAQKNLIVFDDDDAGETADVVEIIEDGQTVTFRFYHCKYSIGATPGERVKDLYEVCGQVVRSSRLVHNAEALLRQLERREKHNLGGRLTRFEKGDRKTLVSLRRRIRKMRTRFEFFVVQPGLSKAALQPDLASVLGAADAYLRDTTGSPLRIVASK